MLSILCKILALFFFNEAAQYSLVTLSAHVLDPRNVCV